MIKLITITIFSTVLSFAATTSNVKLFYGPHELGEQFFAGVAVETSAPGTFFECCGFDRGFTGLYEKADRSRGIVLRIWDVDGGRDNPEKVKQKKRAEVIKSTKNSVVTRFGEDGSGAMIYLPYKWKNKEKLYFLMKADVGEESTEFTAFFHTETVLDWKKIGTIKVANYGIGHLRGYYSSIRPAPVKDASESARKAFFFLPWIKQKDGNWMGFLTGDFTADPPKPNINAGNTLDDLFFLETGGKTIRKAEIMESFSITVKSQPPESIKKLAN